MRCNHTLLKWGALAVLLPWLLTACAARQPQPDPQVVRLEQELAAKSRQLDEMYHRMSVVQFMVDSHEKTIQELQQELEARKAEAAPPEADASPSRSRPEPGPGASLPPAAPGPASPPAPAPSAEDLYASARGLYEQGKYDRAAPVFQTIVRQYPGHDLADNALYWQGECFYSQKEYQQAIDLFQHIIERYPDGGKMPDAMLKIGLAYFSLGDRQNARRYLQRVLKNYPFHPAGTKAEETLARLD